MDSRPGPPTQFRPWHLLAALLIYGEASTPLGRYQLATELGLGGGSIRSLVKYLRRQGLLQPVGRRGHQLSPKGRKYLSSLRRVLVKTSSLPPSSFTVDRWNFGCQLRRRASRVADGLRQRDAALQAGASGATTLVQGSDPNRLLMPANHLIERGEAAPLLQQFQLREGDVLIIGSGPNRVAARLGALAAALTLLDDET